MKQLNIGSFQILDRLDGELSYVGVRVVDDFIGICLVKKESGEPEIFMNIEECQRLVDLLKYAIEKCDKDNS